MCEDQRNLATAAAVGRRACESDADVDSKARRPALVLVAISIPAAQYLHPNEPLGFSGKK